MAEYREQEIQDGQCIAHLLGSFRKSKGLTVEQVSNYLKVPTNVIESIENGTVDIYMRQIYGLLCLYSESVYSVFGSSFEASKVIEKENNNEAANHVKACIAFHKKLHGKSVHLSAVPKARGKTERYPTNFSGTGIPSRQRTKATSLAVLELRAQTIIRKFHLYRLPINVYQILDELGVNVVFESFPSDFYMRVKAFCYRENDFGLIGINKSHPTVLQRYSAAHELHHFLYDFDEKQFLCGPDNESENSEIDAERFAAELLMPKIMIEKIISNPLNINYLTIHLVARHFGVSYEAAAIRLQKFGLVKSSKEVCDQKYRKKDKQKTIFLLQNKLKYLKAVFGLETGIIELQEYDKSIQVHSLCGAPITDASHNVCWQCGLELRQPVAQDFYIKNPYRQNPANLLPEKISSIQNPQDKKFNQLSFNLNIK